MAVYKNIHELRAKRREEERLAEEVSRQRFAASVEQMNRDRASGKALVADEGAERS